ncbi:hypothetical protein [Herpetosiphon geysericola]|uniref:Uncharacterized protein n=1 Tax=Herpetosiphon geysericola TaxID=70996 RepID=A0A0P6XIF2_9CHLR|nr:hypothetical protein [Herpetosiphon geysericola]KPL83004.1 hypothetical protein SE18_19360 [Herpetosiphon geysericola]
MPSTHPSGGATAMRTPPWLAAPDSDYLWVPTQLLATLYDSPTAIGLFTLIVRRWLASDTATVAMSDQDIQRYDPALCRGSIRAAIKRLVDGGWIQVTRHAGRKTQYCPAWGRSTNARLWSKTQPQLNRRRVRTVRLDRKLLDDYMGRLIPHAKAPALIERYGMRAHLTLADVGTYLLMQHTSHAVSATPALEQLDLCFQSEALAVPTTEETLAKMELSEQGARRVGIVKPPVQPRPAHTDPRPALFFVPGELARQLARQLARPAAQAERGFSAAQRGKTAVVKKGSLVTGIKGNKAKKNPPTPLNTTEQVQKKTLCGGELSFRENGERLMRENNEGDATNHRPNQPRRRRSIMSIPETPSAERLRALNVRPQTCAELADLPLDLINACIADGQARPAVRDLAAWTVSMARDARDFGWQVALDKRGVRPTDDFWADPDAAIAKLNARLGRAEEVVADAPKLAAEETPSTPPPPGGGDQQESTATDCPDWIAPAAWQTLSPALRDVLERSHLQGRQVVAYDSGRQRMLADYEAQIERLVIAALLRR